jgi:uncharacterized protein (TIGR04255 family)
MHTETYKNAPITEATLDIRVRVPKAVTIESLENIRDEDYPKLKQRPMQMQVRIVGQVENGKPIQQTAETINTPLGFMFESADQKQVFQVRTDGFTHNRLAPYQNWKSFSSEARRLWEKYKQVAGPEIIELLGINYVNNIYVPAGTEYRTYLRTYLEVAPVLPQNLNTFFLNFQSTWPGDDEILLFVSQAVGPLVRPGFVTVVLNIRAFKTLQRPAADVDEEDMWSLFEKLREVKNAAFEGCITDRVRKEIR